MSTCSRVIAQKLHEAHHVPRVVRLGSTQSVLVVGTSSVIFLDFDIVMHRLYMFCVTRNGSGLVCCFLGSGAAGQPYDSILVGVDMNASQAGYMLSSQLALDCRCDGRVLRERHRV